MASRTDMNRSEERHGFGIALRTMNSIGAAMFTGTSLVSG